MRVVKIHTVQLTEICFVIVNLSNNKRKNRRNRRNQLEEIQEESIPEESIEIRPLVNFKSIEAGMDYWMDERDLAKSLDYERALKNRKVSNVLNSH